MSHDVQICWTSYSSMLFHCLITPLEIRFKRPLLVLPLRISANAGVLLCVLVVTVKLDRVLL